MDNLGSFLKQGREEAGITLEDLAQKTRIRRDNLESLENGDLESLPTDPYVRGFVKLVCRELGLSPREGLVRYEILRARLGPQDEITWSEDRTVESTGRLQRALEDPERVVRRARRMARAGILGGSALVLALLVWGGMALVGRMGGSDAEDSAPVAEAETPKAPEAAPVAVVEEEAAPDPAPALTLPLPFEEVHLTGSAPERIVPEQILVTMRPAGEGGVAAMLPDADVTEAVEEAPDDGAADAAAADAREAEVREAAARDEATRETAARERAERERAAREQAERDRLARDTRARETAVRPPVAARSGARERMTLEVEAIRPVWVAVLLDGIGVARSDSLRAGERRTWKADSLFAFTASDGGGVRIRLAGRDLGVPGLDYQPLDRVMLRRPR